MLMLLPKTLCNYNQTKTMYPWQPSVNATDLRLLREIKRLLAGDNESVEDLLLLPLPLTLHRVPVTSLALLKRLKIEN